MIVGPTPDVGAAQFAVGPAAFQQSHAQITWFIYRFFMIAGDRNLTAEITVQL